jgi:predicted 3-demethylubiquinone-9 3-methyltransferase (glyoxalase superfamily)
MKNITPFLWFDNQAEEAAKFYVSVIKNSKIITITRYSEEAAEAAGRPAGSVMTVDFQLNGQDFMALNGGPGVPFSQAISLMIKCDTQEEIDLLWEKLSEGGEKNVCGWLKDKYGISWQVTPAVIDEMMKDKEGVKRVMRAVLKMTKLDIKKLQEAYDQRKAA